MTTPTIDFQETVLVQSVRIAELESRVLQHEYTDWLNRHPEDGIDVSDTTSATTPLASSIIIAGTTQGGVTLPDPNTYAPPKTLKVDKAGTGITFKNGAYYSANEWKDTDRGIRLGILRAWMREQEDKTFNHALEHLGPDRPTSGLSKARPVMDSFYYKPIRRKDESVEDYEARILPDEQQKIDTLPLEVKKRIGLL